MLRRTAAAVAMASALALAFAGPAGAVGGWQVTQTRNPSAEANYFSDAVALTTNDVWAVGTAYQPNANAGTLAEHWDGSTWRVASTPNPRTGYNELFSVDAVSSTDVWAVGYTHGLGYVDEKTLIEHWDGTRWSAVPSPNLGPNANILYGVAAVSATDVWAVGLGNSTSTRSGRPITMHWDGSAWTLVPSMPIGGGFAELRAIAAISSTDVWAVGSRGSLTLIEHWDGSAWSLVSGPALAGSSLDGVTALSSSDVWAGGAAGSSSLIEHWDGASWSRVPSPNGSKPNTQIDGLGQFGSNDIWAVGSTFDNLQVSFRTVTMHWDGTSWTMMPSPNPSQEYDQLTGVTGIAGGQIWAVGQEEGTLAIRRTDA